MPSPRPHVAIVTKGSRTWMGGRHYTLNLTKLLIDYRRQTGADYDVSVIARGHEELDLYKDLVGELKYCVEIEGSLDDWTLPNRVRWKLKRTFGGWIYPRLEEGFNRMGITFSFPISAAKTPSADWIPDFQYLHFPDGSSDWEIEERKLEFSSCVTKANRVVLSSFAAEADCHHVFPQSRDKTAVFQFRSPINEAALTGEPDLIRRKYNLPERFALISNQLIPTKNHGIVLDALGTMTPAQRKGVTIVCTGDVYDLRNPGFYNGFLSKIQTLGLHDNVRHVGLIPKSDQVQLLRAAHFYLQPSLFEGWNTGVEEARSFGKTILLSDNPVHREQDPPDTEFFDPRDPKDLAAKLSSHFRAEHLGFDRAKEAAAVERYKLLLQECARDFLRIAGVPVGP